MKIVTAEQMKNVDGACESIGLPTSVLMENAGKAVAEEVRRILDMTKRQQIVLLIGPGNNGGDGLVAARYLHDWGGRINLYLFGDRHTDDPNLMSVKDRNINCIEVSNEKDLDALDKSLSSATAVVDAIFGTGSNRPLSGIVEQALKKASLASEKRKIRIIALDLPSGLNSDSGAVDPACLRTDNTITLGFPKIGLFNQPGSEMAGEISIVDIGIPPHLAEEVNVELITPDWARSVLPERPRVANKGSFGKLLVVAGSINYIGAAYLACSGAMRVGTGLVTLATATSLQPILAAKLTEVTYLPLPEASPGIISPEATELIYEELEKYDALLLGCGLGQNQSIISFIESLILSRKRTLPHLILDADALNTLADIPDWWQQIPDNAILTPHPGEMSRLTGTSVEEIQSHRTWITDEKSREWNKTLVLKGAYTVIASPEDSLRISPIANPGLASAGTGDVLSGVIAGLTAQGLKLTNAAACGVYLHGEAGEIVKARLGDAGMVASDLLPELPLVIKKLKENEADR